MLLAKEVGVGCSYSGKPCCRKGSRNTHPEAYSRRQRGRRVRLQAGLHRPAGLLSPVPTVLQADGCVQRHEPRPLRSGLSSGLSPLCTPCREGLTFWVLASQYPCCGISQRLRSSGVNLRGPECPCCVYTWPVELGLCVLCRAEKSFTHRHLCEFTGLDFEMTIDRITMRCWM